MNRVVGIGLIVAALLAISIGAYAVRGPIAIALGTLGSSSRTVRVSPAGAANALDWARAQGVKAGTVRSMRLPPRLIASGNGAPVSIAHLRDGRYCVLVITQIGYKDNFEGVLTCTAPLRPREIIPAAGTYPSYVSLTSCALPGCGVFEELYIRATRNDRTYDVGFDLK
jgi:hypothetical protein